MSSSEQCQKRLLVSQQSDDENTTSQTKRLRQTDEENPNDTSYPDNSDESIASNEFSFEMLDDPVANTEDRRSYHSLIQITTSTKSFVVRAGDSVYLTNDTGGFRWVCKIDRFFIPDDTETRSQSLLDEAGLHKNIDALKMVVTWFLRSYEVQRFNSFYGFASICDRMKTNEVVLSNIKEEMDASFIYKLCKLHTCSEDDEEMFQNIASDHLFCRYMVTVDQEKKTLKWSTYEDGMEVSKDSDSSHHEIKDSKGDTSVAEDDDDDDDDDMSSEEELARNVMQEGEGSTLRGDIAVGPKHQIEIGRYDPNGIASITSRNPKLVWKPSVISDDELHRFFVDLASIHTKYLEENSLIILEEPYTPLRFEAAEKLMKEKLKNTNIARDIVKIMLCGSSMSSASMLGASKSNPNRRNELFRECDVDKVLELLCDHNYNTEEALEAIRSNLYSITTAWNKREREIFDAGYRQQQSSCLREISEVLQPTTKTLKDVVDYHYRFKITDQFRKYQNQKREQALRIVKCIDSRKALNDTQYQSSTTGGTGSGLLTSMTIGRKNSASGDDDSGPVRNVPASIQIDEVHWADKTIASVAQSRDNRVRAAKQLLLDVREALGSDVMKAVAGVIKKMQVAYDASTRESLFHLLSNHPELQSRFLDFLPRQVH